MKKKCGLLLTLFMSVCMTCAVTGSTVREEQGYVIDMHTEQQCERLCENYDIALESDEEGELARQAILVADSDEITKEDIHTIKAEYSAIVEPDYVMEAAYKTAKSDESGCEDYGDTWNLKMIHAEQLTDRVLKPIKVAVIDSGIDFTEELNVTGRKNVVDEGYVVPLYEDITGHGTGIAGIIAARETGNGIRGINPYCELYSVKILDDNNKAPMSRVIQAIYWCIENDIDIIHMSFGMPQYSEILHKAVQDAAEADILMIASAGNNGKNTCYPAAYEEVVSVGAVSSSGELSVFDPDSMELVAPGEKVDTTSFYGGIMTVGGTSIAAAHVTGIASVLWGIDPDKPASFIRRLMQQTAVQTEEMQKRGCGLPDLEYAIIMYDAFCQTEQDKSVSENTISENTVSENTISGNFVSLQNDREVESFEEPDAVEGMWHNDNTDDNKGIHQVDAETYGNTILHLNQTEMKILRYYAGYPDVLTQEAEKNTSANGKIETYPTVNGGGNANYIASLRYLFLTSIRLKKGQSYNDISYKDRYEGNYRRTKSIVDNCVNQNYQNIKNTSKINSLKILGLAFHQIGDIYAHQTVIPKGSASLAIYAGEEHKAVRTKILTGKCRVVELRKIDSSFTAAQYEDNPKFMSKRYTVATKAAEEALMKGYASDSNFLLKWLMPEVLTGNTDYNLKLYNLRTYAKQSVAQQEDNYSDAIWKECSVEE